ncbi:MAG: class I SAM-dependent methyltransferase family protein [Halodesulfurarchaeum sp.]
MTVSCVRVEREAGETTRQRLEEAGLLSETHDIAVDGEDLYIPVTEASAVPDDLEVVQFDAPLRETRTMPEDILGFQPSYERLGEVVIIDEDDPERARKIAGAIMDSDLPVETVMNKASKVKGRERVRDWDVLAGDGTEATHREYGSEFRLDLTTVYFSPRLATERHRVVEQVSASERVFDMFAGVGPYAIPMAKKGATVVATDINADAIRYLRENAERNDVSNSVTAIHGDVQAVALDYEDYADRVVMNLPHSAADFLDAAIQLAGAECTVHYYDIQHEEDPFGPGKSAIEAAAGSEYDVSVETERIVRTYAPHEVNVVLDVRLTAR